MVCNHVVASVSSVKTRQNLIPSVPPLGPGRCDRASRLGKLDRLTASFW